MLNFERVFPKIRSFRQVTPPAEAMVAVMDLPKAVADGKRTRQPCRWANLKAGGLEMFHWWVGRFWGVWLLRVLFCWVFLRYCGFCVVGGLVGLAKIFPPKTKVLSKSECRRLRFFFNLDHQLIRKKYVVLHHPGCFHIPVHETISETP